MILDNNFQAITFKFAISKNDTLCWKLQELEQKKMLLLKD